MNNEPKDDPRNRMRNLTGSPSPLTRLPKKNGTTASFLPKQDDSPAIKTATVEQKPVIKTKVSPQTQPKPARVSKSMNLKFGPPFWTIASAISMTVNVVLLIVVLALLINVKKLNMGSALGIGNDLLGGLYTNFEKMDRAHIKTTIPVTTTIPVKFDLLLNQQTNVVLSQDVTINNALVTVNTGGLNITRALTTIVLPQGTNLPIVLNLTVPVDTTVPVTLNVDVDIPLENTELHEPFAGLQEVVRPFYCMISPNAVKLSGQPVCK
jgi:hypothetical protein